MGCLRTTSEVSNDILMANISGVFKIIISIRENNKPFKQYFQHWLKSGIICIIPEI